MAGGWAAVGDGAALLFSASPGQPVVWYTNRRCTSLIRADLSTTVNHAAADALVAAAATVWNVPTSSAGAGAGRDAGGACERGECLSGANGVVFPADVRAGTTWRCRLRWSTTTDGSVTDMLLGVGASDPSGCWQNAVTESVDSIVPAGYIQHAVLVLNGRCTGSDPAQQLQMQYQLMRAFGRVLGLGWSQTNDNVFTGSPQPTYNQAMHWPVMHPIDIICGTYTYQCMPQPFTLRPDDLSALAQLYPIDQGQAPAGEDRYAVECESDEWPGCSFQRGRGCRG